MSNPNKVRIGVIGAGTWSHYAHFPAIKEHPDAELIAVCQRNKVKLEAAAVKWNIPNTYTDYKVMIEKQPMDGLIIATPHHVHYEQAKLALENGIDVLVEKPMVVRASEARELIAVAKRNGKTIMVGHPLPYTTLAQKARDIIRSGKLGEVKHVTGLFASPAAILYRNDPLPADFGDYVEEHRVEPYNIVTYNSLDVGGGQNQTQVSHTANLIFWVTGRRPIQVSAFMENDGCLVDAYDSISFQLDNSGLGTIASWGTVSYKQKGLHEFRIMGENGLMLLDMNEAKMLIRWQDGKTEDYSRKSSEDLTSDKVFYASDTDLWPRFAPAHNLVDVIMGKGNPVCTGEDELPIVELLEAAAESAEAGGTPIKII
jgi:predicted dehydrogenase